LKSIVSLFFINKQAAAKTAGKRYDGFFATIINDSIDHLPGTIKIISWNYDSQLELSFNNFSKLNSLAANQEKLKIHNKYLNSQMNPKDFSVFKLNGTAGFINDNKVDDFYFGKTKNASDLNFIVEKYLELDMKNSNCQAMSFAWEKVPVETDVTSKAVKSIGNTDILVIIGYSFPDFNREIDLQILRSMQHVEKIFIQDKNPDQIKELLYDIRPDFEFIDNNVKIVERDTIRFHIPHEFKKPKFR
jgi:hypothetical protein